MAVYWTLLVVVLGLGYVIGFTRTGKVSSATIGSRRHELFVPADIDTVFTRLASLDGTFKVDDKDPENKLLVLSSSVTFFTYGFLYPVFLTAEGGGTRIVIGCHSKFFQMGPLVSRAHNGCRDAIESALSIPQARVA